MTKLSPAQLAQVAAGAGFRGSALVDAVAVALAESGGDTAAQHVNSDAYRSVDRGLWQINSHWHPEVTSPFDPAANAAGAYRISNRGTDWRQWSTWNDGAALAQLGRARIAVAQAGHPHAGRNATPTDLPLPIPGLPPGSTLGLGPGGIPLVKPGGVDPIPGMTNPLDVLKSVGDALVRAGAWMSDSHNMLRISLVVTGGVGVLLALDMIAGTGAAGSGVQQVQKGFTEAAEKAAVVAAA